MCVLNTSYVFSINWVQQLLFYCHSEDCMVTSFMFRKRAHINIWQLFKIFTGLLDTAKLKCCQHSNNCIYIWTQTAYQGDNDTQNPTLLEYMLNIRTLSTLLDINANYISRHIPLTRQNVNHQTCIAWPCSGQWPYRAAIHSSTAIHATTGIHLVMSTECEYRGVNTEVWLTIHWGCINCLRLTHLSSPALCNTSQSDSFSRLDGRG